MRIKPKKCLTYASISDKVTKSLVKGKCRWWIEYLKFWNGKCIKVNNDGLNNLKIDKRGQLKKIRERWHLWFYSYILSYVSNYKDC